MPLQEQLSKETMLAALLLLIDYPPLAGESFWIIADIAKPDALLSLNGMTVNLLPLLMAAVTLAETSIKPEMTREGRIKFALVTAAILFLVYPLPAALVLYWMTCNLISLARTCLRLSSPISAPSAR